PRVLFDPQRPGDQLIFAEHLMAAPRQATPAIVDKFILIADKQPARDTRPLQPVQQAQFVNAQDKDKDKGNGDKELNLTPPRLPVIIEPLPGTGAYIIRAQTQADLDAALAIIKMVVEKTKEGQLAPPEEIQLRHADATAVVNQMNQLLLRWSP